jgi:hypothetical protein
MVMHVVKLLFGRIRGKLKLDVIRGVVTGAMASNSSTSSKYAPHASTSWFHNNSILTQNMMNS